MCVDGDECDVILLESNYDPYMLEHGEYPWPLKKRISGGHGHISNPESADSAEFFIKNGTKKFILGHLSPHNNTPDLARKYVDLKVDAITSNRAAWLQEMFR